MINFTSLYNTGKKLYFVKNNKKVEFVKTKKVIEEEKTTPVTLEELESLFPQEPEYPALKLRNDYDLEINLKSDLLTLEVEEGTIVKTKGYYSINDGGQAVYEIMSYDNWWQQLPIELKLIHGCTNRLGNNYLYKNPGDNFGNHKLNNGMIAKILPNLDGYVRVEQYGVFEGRKDNNRAIMAVCAYNHQNSKILFGKNKRYELWYTPESPHWKNADNLSTIGIPKGVSEDSFGKVGNEYALFLHSRSTTKPVIGDAVNLELCGNNCEFYIPDEQFTIGGADFAMFECGGRIDGLKIHGFHLNGNHFGQLWQGTQGSSYARTCNHGISYFSNGINTGNISGEYLKDGNGNVLDIKINDLKNYNGNASETCFNNVEIYGNHFESLGVALASDDCGGDAILIINPLQSDNVNIHNNKVTNYGRWCFSVDLGGNGERFHNYTIKQNICIQNEDNTFAIPFSNPRAKTSTYRGLGFIDFEARKCFTNLDVSENYVYGMNCWAFNGNGKISENITIKRNNITRAPWKYRSGYPYQCSFYSVWAKDLDVRYNKFGGGSMNFGGLAYNYRVENNEFMNPVGIGRPLGNIVYRNNKINLDGGNIAGCINIDFTNNDLPFIDDSTSEFYLLPDAKERHNIEVIIENNEIGGIWGNHFINNDSRHKETSLIIRNNKFKKFQLTAIGLKNYIFDPEQIAKNTTWCARGSKAIKPVIYINGGTLIPGSQYYEEGQIIHNTLDLATSIQSNNYFDSFSDWKNIYGTKNNGEKMICSKSGLFPINGAFSCVDDKDNFFNTFKETDVTKGTYIYTLDNVYRVDIDGTLGTDEPMHTEGSFENGTTTLTWIAPVARYEIIL